MPARVGFSFVAEKLIVQQGAKLVYLPRPRADVLERYAGTKPTEFDTPRYLSDWC